MYYVHIYSFNISFLPCIILSSLIYKRQNVLEIQPNNVYISCSNAFFDNLVNCHSNSLQMTVLIAKNKIIHNKRMSLKICIYSM